MVRHSVTAQGVNLAGVAQTRPVLLRMNDSDFPAAFLRDLGATGTAPLSSVQAVTGSAINPPVLYQPVARVVNLAVVQLACEMPGYPRLDPRKVVSAGLVIRRVPLAGGAPAAAWPWMRNAKGQSAWVPRDISRADDDPDATLRPQSRSGQAALDRLLAAQALNTAMSESYTPAFVAAPEVCNAAGRTLVYAVIPAASSEVNSQQPPLVAQIDDATLAQLMPALVTAGSHNAPRADVAVDYRYMSDDYARARGATDFLAFSLSLRMLYTVFGAFEPTADGQKLLAELNRHHVTLKSGSNFVLRPMGLFFQEAATRLIDYDPIAGPPAPPQVVMPHAWDFFSEKDQADLMQVMKPILQRRGAAATPPEGRFQDSRRLYRLRLFFRVKGDTPVCPPALVWSAYSDPFRIAAWYESGGRTVAPVPLPDPFDRNTMKNAKPTASFAVPPRLMNVIGGATLNGLSSGTAPGSGGGAGLGWICGFNIPIITICAFFVLNIFLALLNIIFFWLPFVKICIPFPAPASKD